MKRSLIILIGLIVLFPLSKASYAYDFIIHGYITSQQTGLPIANHLVKVESADPQFSVYKEAITDAFGHYQVVFTFSGGLQLPLKVSTFDLCGQGNQFTKTVMSVEGTILLSFDICEYLPPSNCEAQFGFTLLPNPGNNTVQSEFTDQSNAAGTIISWFWNFDNGSSSSVQNPGTIYPAYPPSTYNVCLTIATDSQCVNTTCKPLTISDSLFIISNCDADFSFEPDTTTNSLPDFTLINFTDSSTATGNIVTYIWDFGDGNIATSQNPQHAFYNLSADTFVVTLTIFTSDSCSSTSSDSIILSDPVYLQDCQSFFSYHNNPVNPKMISFINLSTTTDTIIDYYWDFGDGSTSVQAEPVHTFPSNSSYDVCLTVFTDDGCVSTYCESVTADSLAQIDCQAAFTYAGSGINTPGIFYDNSYATSQITDWIWDFGDGTVSQEQHPVHSYAQSGFYEVCLTIVTDQWCSSTYCDSIYYEYTNSNCFSGFSFSYNDPPFFNSVSFHNQSSPNTNQWIWDFGDGTSSTLANPLHIYSESGLYNVCLTVETSDNCLNTYCHYILTGDSLSTVSCVANFVYGESGGIFQQGFFYDNSFSNSTITSWNWDFGDGTVSTEQNPVHFYSVSGYYNVCLTIESENGCISEYCDSVFYDTELSSCFAWFEYDNFMQDTCVQFYNQSVLADGVYASVSWYFGDGFNSHELNPLHCFESYGSYDVCLKIISSGGCSDLRCKTIELIPDDGLYSVSGKVTANNAPVLDGQVLLMGKSGYLNKTEIINGQYLFTDVQPDTFITWARSGVALLSFYAPAYHPDKLKWTQSGEFYLDADRDNVDIDLVPFALDSTGTAEIAGVVLWTESNSTHTYHDRLDPSVDHISMCLFDMDDKLLQWQFTSTNGHFSFSDLPFGTYKLFVELAGHITYPAIITLDETNEWVNDIVITVSNGLVFINLDEADSFLRNLLVYPNPAHEQVVLQLPANRACSIRLMDQSGRVLRTIQDVQAPLYFLPLSDLAAGSYFISIQSGSGSQIIRHILHY